jgi:hypothetical protein
MEYVVIIACIIFLSVLFKAITEDRKRDFYKENQF